MLQNAWPAAIGIYAEVLQYRPFGPLRLPQRAGRTPAASKPKAGNKQQASKQQAVLRLAGSAESPIESFHISGARARQETRTAPEPSGIERVWLG
ncbi:hypothetical protein M3I53_27755 [Paraburkholderia sp. CNPSo 3272]|uniref:hypothetical protein n=1 Tax=Paraburkholderia sp. CNPSo 3272 TaxID=2940931 RepID=UPI0020B8460F|nr:hypothetical protein [Paraburkholderia sp. CNPSo 3272]MCP3726881.1 hypothetical protein [Paraburkholderia sp. CNPSo 3272]